jgi:glycogen phosphorylase
MTWAGDRDLAREAEELAGKLPPALSPLAHIASNYRWSWAPGGPELFRDIDPYRWATQRENPVRLLLQAPAESLSRAADNADLLHRADRINRAIHEDLGRPVSVGSADRPIAFLCAIVLSPHTGVDWESLPATSSRKLPTWLSRSWRWGSCTARAISISGST